MTNLSIDIAISNEYNNTFPLNGYSIYLTFYLEMLHNEGYWIAVFKQMQDYNEYR